MKKFRLSKFAALCAISLSIPQLAQACASCGCTLSSDWESLGLSTSSGFKLDVRYDYLDQNQLRSGTGTISPQAASAIVNTNGSQEVEKYTKNNYLTITGDYNFNPSWGVQVQVPYIDRSHATLGTGGDGSSPADGAYESDTNNIG